MAKGDNSKLYVIILNEVDALCPATLITILDEINIPKNILVFGLTNRFEDIEPAILRPE